MPVTRNALLRYRTIDRCLRNRGRRWTLDDLIAAVSDALYEYEGRQVDVSKRTVQLDLQLMRSDKLGYRAPIEVYERKYYRYADPDYAITDSPLSAQDLSRLREVVDTLRQFSGFRQMEAFGGIVGRLRDQLGAGRAGGRRVIDLEHNAQLQGLHWVDPLYEITAAGRRAEIDYQSFRTREPKTYVLEPHFLKESRNRFFVLGYLAGGGRLMIFALDRIRGVRDTGEAFERRPGLEPETFFRHTIGVSVTDQPPEEVRIRLSTARAPYVLTKPLHHSQREVGRGDRYVEIALLVQHTFELESELLALGEDAQVVSPTGLRRRMRQLTQAAASAYEHQPLTPEDFARAAERYRRRGYAFVRQLFSLRELKRLRPAVSRLQRDETLFEEGVAHQALDITTLLPETRAAMVSDVVGAYLEALGQSVARPTRLLLHRYERGATRDFASPDFTASERPRFYIALSRWRERRAGLEVRLGESAVGFDADYGQALMTRAGLPTRVLSQRGQVFWVLESEERESEECESEECESEECESEKRLSEE